MNYLIMLGDAKTEINELVKQGLEIILNSENAVPSIIIQLCATLVLFLAVRFLLWGKITKVIAEKEQNEKEAFENLENAKREAEEIRKQIELDTEKSKEEGYKIIERAKQKSYLEAEEIIKKAQIDANMKLEDAKEEIDKEIAKASEDIKKEIIEIAYMLASKIINEEIDKSKYDELVNDFMKESGVINDWCS